ncbi:hypothetical protein [Haloferula helveola]|uniref:hypothetical protein n=1 Tax=Haloferula helveola TaxID=490095 RepID=UPI0030D48133
MNRSETVRRPHGRPAKSSPAGFALVITVSLMVLLSLLAVGLLSLSTVSLRGSRALGAQAEARSNARMALVMAIGELQRAAGPDQKITAPAGILAGNGAQPPHYTGAWEARGNPRDSNASDGLGRTPGYESSASFDRWLVSNSNWEATRGENFAAAANIQDPVRIIDDGTVGDNPEDEVVAGGIAVEGKQADQRGRLAWWVGENATKASVRVRDESIRDREPTRAEALASAATPGPYGLEALSELSVEANTTDTDKVVSIEEAALLPTRDGGLIPADVLASHYHDLTSDASSLLVNVTQGGLRKDLSLFFEGDPEEGSWEGSIKSGDAPVGPYGETALSPHNEFDTGDWKQLRQHYALHKFRRSDRDGLLTGTMGDTLRAVDDYNPPSRFRAPYPSWNYQRTRVSPVILRFAFVLSLGVEDASRGRVSADKLNQISPKTRTYDPELNKYMVTFHAYPVAALWNPYNLPMECPGFSIGSMGMSIENTVTIGGKSLDYQWINHNYSTEGGQWHVTGMTVDNSFTLAPGEVKMFFGSKEVHRDQAQSYARGSVVRSLRDVSFDASPLGGDFGAGVVKNGVMPNTFNPGDGNFPGDKLLYGFFANRTDQIRLSTNIFTPQGSRAAGPREDFNGLIYYGTYSSFDVRMISRSFGGGNGWRYPALWWINWGGDRAKASQASKWSGKVGWRNDDENPVRLNQPINAFFNVADLVGGRRQPFMVVDLRLKSTEADDDQRNPNVTWLHNIPAHGYAGCSGQGTPGVQVSGAGNVVTAAHSNPYTMHYAPVQSAGAAWNELQLDSIDGEVRPFMGNSYYPGGQHKAVAMEMPLVPLQSIAQLQHVPQVPIDATRWSGLGMQNYAIANSFASPHLPSDQITSEGWLVWLDNRVDNADSRSNQEADLDGKKWYVTVNGTGPPSEHFKPTRHLDRSYVANSLLWDDFFFSGLTEYTGDFYARAGGQRRRLDDVVDGFFGDGETLPNSRHRPSLGGRTADEVSSDVLKAGGYRRAAAYITVDGGFNVNSVSKQAWKAFLASNLRKNQVAFDSRGRLRTEVEKSDLEEYVISRCTLANGESFEVGESSGEKWLGYRVVSEEDLDDLAEKMVEEVKERGPFRSIGEFVNRRLEPGGGDLSLRGALQAALDRSSVNADLASDTIRSSEIFGTDYANESAALLSRHAGSPEYVMQGDLLQSIGPLVQVRSDTFTVRAYGESSDGSAQAWCEATVQRVADWVDPGDDPAGEFVDLTDVSQSFGRRLEIVAFRWLTPSEV